jgi:hypothetical protein
MCCLRLRMDTNSSRTQVNVIDVLKGEWKANQTAGRKDDPKTQTPTQRAPSANPNTSHLQPSPSQPNIEVPITVACATHSHIHSYRSHQSHIALLASLGCEQLRRPVAATGVGEEELGDVGPLECAKLVDGLREEELFLGCEEGGEGEFVHSEDERVWME